MQERQTETPNSTAILVLGIISVVMCGVGLVTGIIALVLSKKSLAEYYSSPEKYTTTSFNNIKTGKTCAIIGVVLSSIVVLFYVLYFAFFLTVLGGAALFEGIK